MYMYMYGPVIGVSVFVCLRLMISCRCLVHDKSLLLSKDPKLRFGYMLDQFLIGFDNAPGVLIDFS